MDRTRSAELIPGSCAGHEADHVQDAGQENPGPDFGEVDARHGGSSKRGHSGWSGPEMVGRPGKRAFES
jgi:hypothetical protein